MEALQCRGAFLASSFNLQGGGERGLETCSHLQHEQMQPCSVWTAHQGTVVLLDADMLILETFCLALLGIKAAHDATQV